MTEDFSRFSFLPIHHENLLSFYRKQSDMLWTAQEIDLSQDRADWEDLDAKTQRLLKFVFCFFSQVDGLVIDNITSRFQEETGALAKEAGHFYIVQNLIETVHSEMYSLMIEVLITDAEEKAKALNAIGHYPSIGRLGHWMRKWSSSDRSLLERVVAFACVEGIIFVAFFVIIWYVKRLNKLPGVTKANEFIARDEALHTLFAVELYHTLAKMVPTFPSKERIREIVTDTVEVAESLVAEALPEDDFAELPRVGLLEYVQLAADNVCFLLTGERIYDASNPFDFMVAIGLPNKTNFFEGRVSEYGRLSSQPTGLEFRTDAEF